MVKQLKPSPSEAMERCFFHRAKQNASEKIADYVARLKKLALHCNFEKLDDALRDQLVCGLNDTDTKIKLFEEKNLTLAKALEISIARESAVKNAASASNALENKNPKSSMYYTQSYPQQSDQGRVAKNGASHSKRPQQQQQQQQQRHHHQQRQQQTQQKKQTFDSKTGILCYCCGKPNHVRRECRFREYACRACNKKGHLERVCKSKNNVNNIESLPESDNASEYDFFSIRHDCTEIVCNTGDVLYNHVEAHPGAKPMYTEIKSSSESSSCLSPEAIVLHANVHARATESLGSENITPAHISECPTQPSGSENALSDGRHIREGFSRRLPAKYRQSSGNRMIDMSGAISRHGMSRMGRKSPSANFAVVPSTPRRSMFTVPFTCPVSVQLAHDCQRTSICCIYNKIADLRSQPGPGEAVQKGRLPPLPRQLQATTRGSTDSTTPKRPAYAKFKYTIHTHTPYTLSSYRVSRIGLFLSRQFLFRGFQRKLQEPTVSPRVYSKLALTTGPIPPLGVLDQLEQRQRFLERCYRCRAPKYYDPEHLFAIEGSTRINLIEFSTHIEALDQSANDLGGQSLTLDLSLQPFDLADAARPGLHAATAPGHHRLLLSQAREAPRALPLQQEPLTSTWLSQVRSVQRGSQGCNELEWNSFEGLQIPLPGHQTRGALQASVHQATALMGLQADHHLRPLRCDLLSRLLARRRVKVFGLCRVQPRHDIGRRELSKRIHEYVRNGRKIRSYSSIEDCAKILRENLSNVNFNLQNKYCDDNDLKSS
ncbi:unnamed protein product [Trichogramma brassicae]|uniref:CCHC-type domain-containing protein n=1 Tax=Trichogramma brassicae TaxID=86971 RepID=A0A6H5IU04_9HYME|nr:unnamed protein product [Trichogramma brassicae]